MGNVTGVNYDSRIQAFCSCYFPNQKVFFSFLVGPLTLHHPDNRPVLPGVMAPLVVRVDHPGVVSHPGLARLGLQPGSG